MNTDVEQAKEILQYFVEHPQSSDDLEGIARWRLMQQQVYRRVEEVHRALELLVQLEFLQQDSTCSSGKRYSLNPAKVAECKRFAGQDNGNVGIS